MEIPKTCESCGQPYVAHRRDQWRCGECRSKNRNSRKRTAINADPHSDRNERKRIKKEQHVRDGISGRRYFGLDGEGITEPSNYYDPYWEDGDEVTDRHRYKVMQMSSANPDGSITHYPDLDPRPGESYLKTQDILWWLWRNTAKTEEERESGQIGPSLWFYGSKYDWTMIFYDIAREDPEFLDEVFHPPIDDPFKTYWWHGWGITYVQSSVSIKRRWTGPDGKKVTNERFFQDGFKCWGAGSFVSQLKSWQVCGPEVIDHIEAMKEKRAHFAEIDDEVREYCRTEVDLLALMAQKITVIASGLDIRPNKWYSAGSAAKALLRNHKIAADDKTGWEGYRGTDRYAGAPEPFRDILDRTFFGGWFDLFETGVFEELHMIDLAAAYPAVIKELPCLSHGHWSDYRSDHPRALTFGRVRFVANCDAMIGPFPWRSPDGGLTRPQYGEGWYVGEIIDSARRLGTFDIDELEWISFVPDCECEPFDWVQEVYDQRLALGKDGAGIVLKVTLNSVYGVFADTISLDSRYASVVWAATITGRTQAKIIDVIADNPGQVVMTATDGIMSKTPIVTTLSPPAKVLGGWDYEGASRDVLLVQPGLYLAANSDSSKKLARSRGHALRDMQEIEAQLRDAWERDGWAGEVSYERTRFIPGKLALTRTDPMAVYGQWIEQPVKIKFKPSSRLIDPRDTGPTRPSYCPMGHVTGDPETELSAPYDRLASMRWNQALIDLKELEDGQPGG